MVNYNNGKIYKIVCNETGEVYYGCTTQKLSSRKRNHVAKAKDKECTSHIIINRGNWTMSLIERYSCSSKEELQARENEYILNNPCVNKNRTYNTPEERELMKQKHKAQTAKWCEENREYYLEKQREHYEENKDKYLERANNYYEKNKEAIIQKHCEKFNCPCGGKYTYSHKPRHLKTKKHQDYLTNKN